MAYKRLKSGKSISSEKAAELSLCAKEQLYNSVKNQFIETMKLPAGFEEISSGINTMGYLILRTGHDLNEYYEAVSGKENFKNKKAEICGIVSDICKKTEPFVEKSGISVICRIPNENIFVNVDEEKFCYAVLNILLNAAENTAKGGRIRVNIEKTKKFVKITIGDNGSGMDEETASCCFEPFFTKGEIRGRKRMGLGLTLAHHFAAKSGGRINIRTEKGKGTAVSLLLPILTESEATLSVETETPDIPGEKLSPVYIVFSGFVK